MLKIQSDWYEWTVFYVSIEKWTGSEDGKEVVSVWNIVSPSGFPHSSPPLHLICNVHPPMLLESFLF